MQVKSIAECSVYCVWIILWLYNAPRGAFAFDVLLYMLFLSSADFKNALKHQIGSLSVSNILDQDHDQYSVGPDLGPNCLQRFQYTTKVAASK